MIRALRHRDLATPRALLAAGLALVVACQVALARPASAGWIAVCAGLEIRLVAVDGETSRAEPCPYYGLFAVDLAPPPAAPPLGALAAPPRLAAEVVRVLGATFEPRSRGPPAAARP